VATNRQIGEKGEQLALSFLSSQGYLLLERNFRCRLGEIDLIMKDGKTVVFVEVKSRSSRNWGLPQEAVHPRKQAKIRRVAQYYLLLKKISEVPVRFDVVAVDFFERGRPVVNHLKGVF